MIDIRQYPALQFTEYLYNHRISSTTKLLEILIISILQVMRRIVPQKMKTSYLKLRT